MDKQKFLREYFSNNAGLSSEDKTWQTLSHTGQAKKAGVTKKDFHEWWISREFVSTHKPAPRKKKYAASIHAYGPRDIYQIDIMVYSKRQKQTGSSQYSYAKNNRQYALLVIDVYSRFLAGRLFAHPTSDNIISALKEIFTELGNGDLQAGMPENITCDNQFGTVKMKEAIDETVPQSGDALMQNVENAVNQASTHHVRWWKTQPGTDKEGDFEAEKGRVGIIERVIRTLRDKIEVEHHERHQKLTNEVLQEVIKTYNNESHKTLAHSSGDIKNDLEEYKHKHGVEEVPANVQEQMDERKWVRPVDLWNVNVGVHNPQSVYTNKVKIKSRVRILEQVENRKGVNGVVSLKQVPSKELYEVVGNQGNKWLLRKIGARGTLKRAYARSEIEVDKQGDLKGLEPGMKVRIALNKGKYGKAHGANWSTEVYMIDKRVGNKFTLKDSADKTVTRGSDATPRRFAASDLQLVQNINTMIKTGSMVQTNALAPEVVKAVQVEAKEMKSMGNTAGAGYTTKALHKAQQELADHNPGGGTYEAPDISKHGRGKRKHQPTLQMLEGIISEEHTNGSKRQKKATRVSVRPKTNKPGTFRAFPHG